MVKPYDTLADMYAFPGLSEAIIGVKVALVSMVTIHKSILLKVENRDGYIAFDTSIYFYSLDTFVAFTMFISFKYFRSFEYFNYISGYTIIVPFE